MAHAIAGEYLGNILKLSMPANHIRKEVGRKEQKNEREKLTKCRLTIACKSHEAGWKSGQESMITAYDRRKRDSQL